MLFVVVCSWCVVCCVLLVSVVCCVCSVFIVRCSLFAGCGWSCVVCRFYIYMYVHDCWLMFVVGCWLFDVCCVLVLVCCLSFVVGCFVVRCWVFGVCSVFVFGVLWFGVLVFG